MAESKKTKGASRSAPKRSKPEPEVEEVRALEEKWGKEILSQGWTVIPNILIERQQSLGLDTTDMAILQVLLKYWWDERKLPFPSKATIADMIGREATTVQRHIRAMEKSGLLVRKARVSDKGQSSNEYNLRPLIKKLHKLSIVEIKLKADRDTEDSRRRRGRHSGEGEV